VCPILWLYRQSLELHLKALVGEGSNFLKSKTDPISLYQTHSLRWLAQIVCQVIKAVGWESEFVCEGISNLAGFSSLINEIESLDPVSCATSFANARDRGWASRTFQKINGAQFAGKLDALLDLLDATTDALAATWNQHSEHEPEGGGDFGLTIQ
jgi:hypothetical protein